MSLLALLLYKFLSRVIILLKCSVLMLKYPIPASLICLSIMMGAMCSGPHAFDGLLLLSPVFISSTSKITCCSGGNTL